MDANQHYQAAQDSWASVTRELDPETLTTAHSLLAIAGFLKIIAEGQTAP